MDILMWFWFVLLCWLMKLGIFSYACASFLHLLWSVQTFSLLIRLLVLLRFRNFLKHICSRLSPLSDTCIESMFYQSSACLYIVLMMSFEDRSFPGGSEGKASACNAGDLGSIPESGRSPGEGNGNPLQYSCLENPMDRGAW